MKKIQLANGYINHIEIKTFNYNGGKGISGSFFYVGNEIENKYEYKVKEILFIGSSNELYFDDNIEMLNIWNENVEDLKEQMTKLIKVFL